MARGQRKTLDEKIAVKEKQIASLNIRLESEKKELAGLYKEKKEAQLEDIGSMLEQWSISPIEAAQALKEYIDGRQTQAVS